ncbi:hydrogenase maturation protease [Streptomyces telluris]|uniref:Hydrogenase maturation protease n=1 Tax=Streptomyces telluris TaxID=2720021 RepID=A0A9X2LGM7_9ACTN|nr:hydrogenase maturation protease [Streptomyces telluris]MCQ8770512.1 hydrogenase maturation protease [Streptomyces telluris]NJP81878.1 hydrogenase maturation protease [Streptomyces telluris]
MAVSSRITVIGVGNEFRRDDGVGPAVVARLQERATRGGLPAGIRLVCSDGEPGRLIGLWEGAELVVVVDAAHAHPGDPGRIHRLELDGYKAWQAGTASSHGLGLGEAVELARALGRLPPRLIVYAVEGTDGSLGTGLTPAVAGALGTLVEQVEQEITGHLVAPSRRTTPRSVRL